MANNYISPVRTESMALAGAIMDPTLLQIRYISSTDDTVFTEYEKASVEIDANGGTAELRVILDLNRDGTTTTENIDGNTYDTLEEMVTAINDLDNFEARIGSALSTHDTGSDDFDDLAETWLPEGVWTGCLQASTGAIKESYLRLNNYTYGKKGLVTIHQMLVNATFATTCNLVIRDEDATQLFSEVLTTATLTTVDWTSNPRDIAGPIFIGLEPAGAAPTAITQFDVNYSLQRN